MTYQFLDDIQAVDAHTHVVLPFEHYVAMFDVANVDMGVLLITAPHPERATTLAALQDEWAILWNILSAKVPPGEARRANIEEQEQALAHRPGRFLPFAWCPTGLDLDTTVAWLEKELVARKYHGIGEISPPPGNFGLLENIVKASATLGNYPVLVHGANPTAKTDLLVVAEIARKYPNVPVIIGQFGGTEWMTVVEIATSIRNVYFDISTPLVHFSPGIAAAEVPEQVFFASDAPYADPLVMRVIVDRSITDSGVRRSVLRDNFLRVIQR